MLGQVVRPAAAAGAVAGAALLLAFRRREAHVPLVALAASLAGTGLAVAAGTPLNPRYLLLPAVLCLLLCAAALVGWTALPRSPARRAWQTVAVVVALLLLATAPGEIRRLSGVRDRLAFQSSVASQGERLASEVACGSPALPGGRLVPLLALSLDRPLGSLAVARGTAPADRPYLAPATPRVRRDYLLVRSVPRPPRAAPTAVSRSWRLYGRCR